MKKIYLDYAASTPIDPVVIEAMKPYLAEKFGNPSSIHSFGRDARVGLDESRDTIAASINAHPSEIYFMATGTEANNFALKGVALTERREGKNHIITSKVEHHSVLETLEYLEKNGFEISHLDVDSYGMVNPDDVRKSIRKSTAIISIMHANNEIGTINPAEAISKISKEHNIVFHTDAIQSFGKIDIDVNNLGADLISLSAHKIYGPKGIGALFIRRGIEIQKLIHGGGQERGRRSGTENVAYAVGFAKAAEIICRQRDADNLHLKKIRDLLMNLLKDKFPFIIFNGHPTNSLPNILSISLDSKQIEIDGEALIMNLDINGIAVSSGSACTSGSIKPSHVLLAIGRDITTTNSTIRFSFGRNTSNEDILYAVEKLDEIIKRIGKLKV